mmetsp:Transcript_10852/g.9231  ORF Transcript_10852/g.9231 Transcript_10852/m.9231 type:complete len:90 (+) Transcript_10852:34-303(+)
MPGQVTTGDGKKGDVISVDGTSCDDGINNNMLLSDILDTLQRSERLLKSVRDENSELRSQLGVLEEQLDRTRENLRDLTARKLLLQHRL